MPEIVDDAKETTEDNWKPAVAYGLASGVGGSMLGPVGEGAGALAAGSYVGGEKGDTIAYMGGGTALKNLLNSGGSGGGNNSQGVK